MPSPLMLALLLGPVILIEGSGERGAKSAGGEMGGGTASDEKQPPIQVMREAQALALPCDEIKFLHETRLAKRAAQLQAAFAQTAGGPGNREVNHLTF